MIEWSEFDEEKIECGKDYLFWIPTTKTVYMGFRNAQNGKIWFVDFPCGMFEVKKEYWGNWPSLYCEITTP